LRSRLTTDDVIDCPTSPELPICFRQQFLYTGHRDLLSPFITELFSRSPSTGRFPAGIRQSFITLIVKKPGLDAVDASSYRPTSNLPALSKLQKRLVARQLMGVQSSADLLPTRQSGFRPGHSTEIAVLRVLSYILLALDRGDRDLAALILLDLMAAFDTVDHGILLQRLQRSFGIKNVALQWYELDAGTVAVRTTRRC